MCFYFHLTTKMTMMMMMTTFNDDRYVLTKWSFHTELCTVADHSKPKTITTGNVPRVRAIQVTYQQVTYHVSPVLLHTTTASSPLRCSVAPSGGSKFPHPNTAHDTALNTITYYRIYSNRSWSREEISTRRGMTLFVDTKRRPIINYLNCASRNFLLTYFLTYLLFWRQTVLVQFINWIQNGGRGLLYNCSLAKTNQTWVFKHPRPLRPRWSAALNVEVRRYGEGCSCNNSLLNV